MPRARNRRATWLADVEAFGDSIGDRANFDIGDFQSELTKTRVDLTEDLQLARDFHFERGKVAAVVLHESNPQTRRRMNARKCFHAAPCR